MKKIFFVKRMGIAVLCTVSLLFSALASASRPDNLYMENAKCLSLGVNEEYGTMIVNGYYPALNAPHYQLVLAPGYIYKDKVYWVEEVEEDVFADQTFSQIYVETDHGISIGQRAFQNVKVQNVSGSAVTDHAVELEGDSVTGIGQYAFAGMWTASRFTIESLAGSVGVRAFENATVCGALTIGGAIGTIGAGAFSGATAREWNLTAKIQRLEAGAFQNTNIQEFTIDESMQYLGSGVFEGSDLTRLYLPDGDFQGKAAQDALPDKEGLTIVIPSGDTDLSAFHLEDFQNAVFEVPSDLSEDSPVMQFLTEYSLKYKRAVNEPTESASPATTAPGEETDTSAPAESDAPVTTAPGEEADTPAPTGSNAPVTTAPGEEADTPAPTGSNAPATTAPGGETDTPAPTGSSPHATPAPEGNGGQSTPAPTGSQQGGQDRDANAGKEKKNFSSKKIKYRVTARNQVAAQGASSKKLSKITIPDTVVCQGRLYKVTAIGKKAFYGCSKVKQVHIGNYVKSVGEQAFAKCRRLKSITFGRKVTAVGARTLFQDRSIKRVTFRGKLLKKIGKKAFRGVPKSVRITVPRTKAKKYKRLILKAK